MSLSDCIKCWSTPCTCGYEYRLWSKADRIKQAGIILGVTEEASTKPYHCPNCGTQGVCKKMCKFIDNSISYKCTSCKFEFTMGAKDE